MAACCLHPFYNIRFVYFNFRHTVLQFSQVESATAGEPSAVTGDGDQSKPPSKWSFAGVVNAAFHSSERKKKLSKDVSCTGIELNYIEHKHEDDKISINSVDSYYMDRDFRYYFQHPYFRLVIAYLVTFCNFLIYAEDPVAHSDKECFIPVVGNCFSFVCTKYPSNGWAALKVFLWVLAIIIGLVVGKIIVHTYVFSKYFLQQ